MRFHHTTKWSSGAMMSWGRAPYCLLFFSCHHHATPRPSPVPSSRIFSRGLYIESRTSFSIKIRLTICTNGWNSPMSPFFLIAPCRSKTGEGRRRKARA
ncbi:hypothetical protein BDZ94DRAFT_1275593 [Collybia nuda]|uniref:Uncharacterized protein n=1 Tax=Collybia nuda TaxID=64659 RepID=A0A9P6CCV4_9AGAR|nr:hypothetical protein BDZ94DRAFT_1275593 [Collybia nuda]